MPVFEPKLWLYVNVTEECNCACRFCAHEKGREMADPDFLRRVLVRLGEHIAGVTLTGGEPMLHPKLVEALIDAVPAGFRLNLITNGANIEQLPELKGISRLTTLRISRHAAEDDKNRLLMRGEAPGGADIARLAARLREPAMLALNCVMQKGGVENADQAVEYLEQAIRWGIGSVGFIAMMPANEFCRQAYRPPFAPDERFEVWDRYRDGEYCSCCNGDYQGKIRFYIRTSEKAYGAPLCRQLVLTGRTLRDGFGNHRDIIMKI